MEWANSAWNTFHIIAMYYSIELPNVTKWNDFLAQFCKNIVCLTCKNDFSKIIREYKPGNSPFESSVILHNAVNKKLNVAEYPLDVAIIKYKKMWNSKYRNTPIRTYANYLVQYLKDGDLDRQKMNELFKHFEYFM